MCGHGVTVPLSALALQLTVMCLRNTISLVISQNFIIITVIGNIFLGCRKYISNLDLTVQWYNKIRSTVIEVEFPLVESQLADIDTQLMKAEKDLDWNSEGRTLVASTLN